MGCVAWAVEEGGEGLWGEGEEGREGLGPEGVERGDVEDRAEGGYGPGWKGVGRCEGEAAW